MDNTVLSKAIHKSIRDHAFSGVVSIRHHNTLLVEMAAGFADRSNAIKNRVDTRFGIASGTKFFTALAIGRLIADGKLQLSTRVNECLSYKFPWYSPDITIQHLLTHTSGIPDYYDEENVEDFDNFFLNIPWYELKGPKDYLPLFPDEDMKFNPGERFSYSNGGYILLGVVIEELSGMRYQDYVEQKVFKLAGMEHSGFFRMDRLPENTALGYVEEAAGWRTNIYNLPIIGASDGGAYTTAQDVAICWDAFWNDHILPKELVQLFTRPFVKAEGEGANTHYGHGIWIFDDLKRHREYFTGCDAGVSFMSLVDRNEGLLITVLSNTTDGAWPVLRDINKILEEYFKTEHSP